MKYIVIHHHPEKLIMSQLQRDMLFSTGNVIRVIESSYSSLQHKYIESIRYRPLIVILWGLTDPYDCCGELDTELLIANNWSDTYNYTRNYRPSNQKITLEDTNIVQESIVWNAI